MARKLGLNNFDTDRCYVGIKAYYENVKLTDPNSLEAHFVENALPGYFWIFPVGNNVSNVGLGIIAEEVPKRKINLKNLMDDIIKNSHLSHKFIEAKQISEIRGWNLPTGAQKRKRAGDGFLLVGDAASLIDPFTGEGIGNALLSGKFAFEVILESLKKNDFSYETLKDYENKINERLNKGFAAGYTIVRLARNKHIFRGLMDEFINHKEYLVKVLTAFTNSEKPGKIPVMLYVKIVIRALINMITRPKLNVK
ncbi:MAG: NAD(P)/FAD-dependent oxidoreductase [Candidatus Aenigmarchaeota archaeon]|nr:NAD(P)/FAD-dependent oxidoreductase [Candidatus Aenigmarchaeota archaeon]